jgi:NAD(P)-dependent dehydrogenase (short-subunit alcohol dehydrogenase family)
MATEANAEATTSGAGEGATAATSAALPDLFDLSGRTAIVTGASGGLGAHFAAVLADAGAHVIASARRADKLTELAATHERIEACACDVTDADSRAALLEAALAHDGRVDILINNAGIGDASPAETEPLEDFQRMVDVNLVSTFAVAQLVGRQMLEQDTGGTIVNLASMFGLVASAPLNQASYCASKGGVVNLTRQLGAEWARRGVRVNALAPGFFPSDMTTGISEDEKAMKWVRRNAPIGRMGQLRELDGALLLLASDAGAYIVGQTIAVDGGWTVT